MLYKTIWLIEDSEDNTKTKFTYYHFGKEPRFPTWYFEAQHVYTIEMLWNVKLVCSCFFKCLFHEYVIE
jgi:hypothetical protein